MRPDRNHSIQTDHSEPVAAAVLAGGKGSRIGGGKAGILLAGRPMIEYPLESLRRAGLKPFVVAKPDHGLNLGEIEVVAESDEPYHPLLGIMTAIEAASGRPTLVVACDLPLLPPELLVRLATEPGDTVAACGNRKLQPLVARYGPGSISVIEAALSAGASVKTTLGELNPVTVEVAGTDGFGDPSVIFHNVNTRQDLERAEEFLNRTRPTG